MSETSDGFRELLLEQLRAWKEKLSLGEPTAGEEKDLFAWAVVKPFDDGLKDRVLVFSRCRNALMMRVHNVMLLGSRGDVLNRTCSNLLQRMFSPDKDPDETLNEDQWMMLGMQVDCYRRDSRTVDELLAHLVNGSNDLTIRSKAYVGWVTGEVFVEIALPCDFDSLPEDLEAAVMGVLSHASQLVRIQHLVRKKLSGDVPLSPRTLNRLTRKFEEIFEAKKPAAEQQPAESTAGEGALTL